MENKNMIGGIVSLAVVVICVAAIMMPVLNDVTETEKTFTNEGYARYTSVESADADAITIVWEYDNPTQFTIGTEVIDYSDVDTSLSYSIVFGEDWSIRYGIGSSYSSLQYMGNSNSDYLLVKTTSEVDVTITLSAGTMTITDGTTTKTNDYSTAYYPDNDGSMTMKKSDETAYLLMSSSIISANGITNVSGTGTGVRFEGTIEDGYTFTLYRDSQSSTIDNVVSNYTEIERYTDLVELSTITFDITPDGGTATAATYSYFLVPYEVTADVAEPLGSGERALLGAIPVLVIVALVIAALGIAIPSRRD